MTLPAGWITHELPGRLRVHVPERRRDEQFCQRVRKSLADESGIEHVEANALTGNILLLHQLDSARIAEIAQAHELFSITDEREQSSAIPRAIDPLAGSFIRSGSLGHYDRLALVLVALACLEILRGNVMAPAVTLLWYALRLRQIEAYPAGESMAPAA